jgi:hypothetical protein
MSPYGAPFWRITPVVRFLIACFAAFIIGEPETRWSLMPRLRRWLQQRFGGH